MPNPHAVIRSAAKWVAGRPVIGGPAARTLERAGAVHLARRVSLLHGAEIASKVTCLLPTSQFHESCLTLDTAGGRDLVARKLWTHGWDGFEPPLPTFFSVVLADGDIMLDVGANTGYYSLLAASIGPRTEVHAFEPFPQIFELLKANLARNPQGGRVRAVPAAASDTCGKAELYIPSGDHCLIESSASLERDFREPTASVMVPTTTLDAYTADLPQVNVIKIDVESAEHRVLAGARETLRRHRPVVFCEILDCADCAAIGAICRDTDYLSIRLRPGAAVVADSVASDGQWTNQALWPAERLEQLQDACRALHYSVVSSRSR
jgi:FkbM family methyltransferase